MIEAGGKGTAGTKMHANRAYQPKAIAAAGKLAAQAGTSGPTVEALRAGDPKQR